VRHLHVSDLRNIREVHLPLQPGLNVLVGCNGQGKTSLLEALAILARGRSFRTEQLRSVVRWGQERASVRGLAVDQEHESHLQVEVTARARRLKLGGSDVTPRGYNGRLEVAFYSTERLKVVRGTMRERRQYFDRSAAALWPAYRRLLRDYQRAQTQRGAAIESGSRDLAVWDDALVALGAQLRCRRASYLALLQAALDGGYRPAAERYTVGLDLAELPADEEDARRQLRAELDQRRADERARRRGLVGPHRDPIRLHVDGHDASHTASSGQIRSLLLALTLAALDVYRNQTGRTAVALLDDLDSELDEQRLRRLCHEVVTRGQAVVTTAHPRWPTRLDDPPSVFEVVAGAVRPA